MIIISVIPAQTLALEDSDNIAGYPGNSIGIGVDALEKIAGRFARDGVAGDSNAAWLVADLIAFEDAYPSSLNKLSAERRLDVAEEIVGETETVSDVGAITQYIIALRALGYDARYMTAPSGTEINLVSRLTTLVDADDAGVYSIYTLPYVLMALRQHRDYATREQIDKLINYALSIADAGDGGWSTDWGFEDTTSAMISALAPYYSSNAQVKTAIDKGLIRLEGAQRIDGGIGANWSDAAKPNASSTGLAMAAFASVGIDPATVVNGGKSLLDGLLSCLNAEGDALGDTSTSYDTEQGFRGLLAAVRAAAGGAYIIYDFSTKPDEPVPMLSVGGCPVFFNVIPGDASIAVTIGGVTQGVESGKPYYNLDAGSYDYTISKDNYTTKSGSFTVSADDARNHTRKNIRVSLSYAGLPTSPDIMVTVDIKTHSGDGSTPYTYKHNANKYTNLASRTLTIKSGVSVFDVLDLALTEAGLAYVEESTGYVSSINGLNELSNGPNSGWMYMVGNILSQSGSREVKLTSSGTVTWFYTDDYTKESSSEVQIITGGDPDTELTRAMLTAMLYKLEGEPKVTTQSPFDDVAGGQWYTDAVIWAYETGIVIGYGGGLFGTDDSITREQIAVILMRFAEIKGQDTGVTVNLEHHNDANLISDWAKDAVSWASSKGIMTSRTSAEFAPDATATCAEAAEILTRFIESLV